MSVGWKRYFWLNRGSIVSNISVRQNIGSNTTGLVLYNFQSVTERSQIMDNREILCEFLVVKFCTLFECNRTSVVCAFHWELLIWNSFRWPFLDFRNCTESSEIVRAALNLEIGSSINLAFPLEFKVQIKLCTSFGNWNPNYYQIYPLKDELPYEMECRCDSI